MLKWELSSFVVQRPHTDKQQARTYLQAPLIIDWSGQGWSSCSREEQDKRLTTPNTEGCTHNYSDYMIFVSPADFNMSFWQEKRINSSTDAHVSAMYWRVWVKYWRCCTLLLCVNENTDVFVCVFVHMSTPANPLAPSRSTPLWSR